MKHLYDLYSVSPGTKKKEKNTLIQCELQFHWVKLYFSINQERNYYRFLRNKTSLFGHCNSSIPLGKRLLSFMYGRLCQKGSRKAIFFLVSLTCPAKRIRRCKTMVVVYDLENRTSRDKNIKLFLANAAWRGRECRPGPTGQTSAQKPLSSLLPISANFILKYKACMSFLKHLSK